MAHFRNGDKVATDRDYSWSGVPKKFSDPPVWYHRGPWKGKGKYVKFKVSHDCRVYITKHPSKSFGRKLIDQGYRDSGYTIEGTFGKSKQHLPCVQKGYPAGEVEIEMPNPDCCPCVFVRPRYKEMDVEAKKEKERTVSTSLEKICKAAADKEKFGKCSAVLEKMVKHTGEGKVTKHEGGYEVYKFLAVAMADPLRASETTKMKGIYSSMFDTCLAREELFTEAEIEQVKVWQNYWITLRTVTLTDDSYEFPKATKALLKEIAALPEYAAEEDTYRGVNNSLEGAYRPRAASVAGAGATPPLPPSVKTEVPTMPDSAKPPMPGNATRAVAPVVKTEEPEKDTPAGPMKVEGGEEPPAPEAPAAAAAKEGTPTGTPAGTEGDDGSDSDPESEEEEAYVLENAEDGIFTKDTPMAKKPDTPEVVQQKAEEKEARRLKRERREKAKTVIKARRAAREQAAKDKLQALKERREWRRDNTEVKHACLRTQRRHAIFQVLKAVNGMYKFNWAKTTIDILLKEVRLHLDRFAPEHRDQVQQFYVNSTSASQTRVQQRQQSGTEGLTSFESADKFWAASDVSARGALVGGGRVKNGQEGKMFGQHDQ